MQFDNSLSRCCWSWIVPESTALNIMVSPESLPILAELAPSTSARVGNLLSVSFSTSSIERAKHTVLSLRVSRGNQEVGRAF